MPRRYPKSAILELDTQGYTVVQIRDKLGYSSTGPILDVLREVGRNKNISLTKFLSKNPNANLHAFSDSNNREDCYWYGIMVSDGCLQKNGSLRINLKTDDVQHLEKFQKYLSINNPIRHYEDVKETGYISKKSSLTFSCSIYRENLRKLGYQERKSLVEKLPPNDWQTVDFWRGMMDGDGTVSMSVKSNGVVSPTVSLCGSEEIIGGYVNFIHKSLGFKPSIRARKLASGNGYLHIATNSCHKAYLVSKLIYSGAPENIRLERKYQKYLILEEAYKTIKPKPRLKDNYKRL